MKIRSYLKLSVVSLLFAVLWLSVTLTAQEVVTVSGIVSGWEWDEDDNVTVVAISSEDRDVIVGDTPKGKELLTLVDHKVEATGTFVLDENEVNVFLVTEYEDHGIVEPEIEESEETEPDPENN